MNRSQPVRFAALLMVLAVAVPGFARPAPQRPGPVAGGAGDERSAVLLRRVCESELSRQELTLFANGTVRLRERSPAEVGGPGVEWPVEGDGDGRERMYLGELSPDELGTYVRRLQGEDLGEVEGAGAAGMVAGPGGAWVEECRLSLRFDAMARWVGPPPARDADAGDWVPAGELDFRYGRYDRLPLPLSRVVDLLDLVQGRVDRAAGRNTLPPRYRPRPGDVLRRADGVLFRVERPTAEGSGWELQGVEQPLTIYVVESEIPKLFTTLEARP